MAVARQRDVTAGLVQLQANAKAAGIRVYSILLMETDNRAVTLMRNCATSPDLYFNSPSAANSRRRSSLALAHVARAQVPYTIT